MSNRRRVAPTLIDVEFLRSLAPSNGMYIFACARKDELLRRWHVHGDLAALDLLLTAVPPDLPARTLRADRNVEVRHVGAWLNKIDPTMSRRRVAKILAIAGRMVEQREPLWGELFAFLTPAERQQLANKMATVLDRAPPARRDSRWPHERQLFSILCNPPPVAIAQDFRPRSSSPQSRRPKRQGRKAC